MKTVFIVDDNDTNLMVAKTALQGAYKTFALPSAERMFKLLEHIYPDLILLDVDMPGINGFEAMKLLKADKHFNAIPVIFLTGMHDTNAEICGFEMGALDFIIKPFSAPVLIRRIESHIETDRMIKESQRNVHNIYNAAINVLADLVESRDQITGGHIERTQRYLGILIDGLIRTGIYAKEMSSWDTSILLPSAQLHDVGKITISDTILHKPGKLTPEEFEMIKTHSTEGERIIERIINKTNEGGFLLHAKKFAGYHHEKWNGSGYPRGLRGNEIPLEGRIMAISDVYDALVSERPYKKAFSHKQAVEIIESEKGLHFDPVLVDIFLNVAGAFNKEGR